MHWRTRGSAGNAAAGTARRVLVALLGLLVLAGLPGAPRAQQQSQPVLTGADLASRIHALVNAERAKHGLAVLGWSDALGRIALAHSRDMARRNYLSHDSPEGDAFGERYRQQGFRCAIRDGEVIWQGAENIALARLWNSATTSSDGTSRYDWNSADRIARTTVDNWMRSRGHRENILEAVWRQQGIGVAIGPGNKVLVTQNFC